MGAVAHAEKTLFDESVARKVRGAWIRLGMVTPERANVYGLDFEELRTQTTQP